MTEKVKTAIKSIAITALLGLLTMACGWFTLYLNSMDNAYAKGFGTLVFGSLTFIFLIGAIFAPSVIRDASAAHEK